MNTSAHRSALVEKHVAIENQISDEMKRPQPDHSRISNLKKEKLMLKERLEGVH